MICYKSLDTRIAEEIAVREQMWFKGYEDVITEKLCYPWKLNQAAYVCRLIPSANNRYASYLSGRISGMARLRRWHSENKKAP